MKPVVLFVELKISAKNKYVCDITEKLYDNNISVCIYAPEEAPKIDALLWTWKQESFVPHSIILEKADGARDPVLICDAAEKLISTQALILMQPLPQESLLNYNLVIDFAEVFHSEKVAESRKRFKKLRDSGKFDVHFSQLGAILAKESISLNFTS